VSGQVLQNQRADEARGRRRHHDAHFRAPAEQFAQHPGCFVGGDAAAHAKENSMCLLVVAHRTHPDLPLLLLANRDEYRARPAAPLAFWQDEPAILGGRDLQAGGTWLAFGRDGRWAALTNVRDGEMTRPGSPSRGELVANYLRDTSSPEQYADSLDAEAYLGFNLLLGTARDVLYVSNRAPRSWLQPGVHGLSNAAIDTPWPKLVLAREAVEAKLEATPEELLRVFLRRGPEAGLGSIFVDLGVYGTRCTTLAIRRGERTEVWEMTHPTGTVAHELL
jgi:uncharacterized protein with NRDE domain